MKGLSMNSFFRVKLLAGFIIALFAARCPGATTLPKIAKLLPPETVFLASTDDFQQVKSQFEKTSLYKLYKDPVMAAFVNSFKVKWRQQVGELDANDLFRAIVDADVVPKGRFGFAMVLDQKVVDPNNAPLLLISQWGDDIGKLKEAINKLVEKNIEMGGRQMRPADYRGITIRKLADESSEKLFYCFIEDTFLCAGREDLLKFVIAHIKGATSPTLADDPDYSATIAALGPYHDMDFFFNIKQIIKTSLAEDTTSATQTSLSILGFDNIAAIGCSVGIARRPGSCWSGKVFIKVNGAKKGVLKMLELEPVVIRAPGFAPASTYGITIVNLDINKAFNELSNILYGFNPFLAVMLNIPLLPPTEAQVQGQLQLKSDIIGHLGSQIVMSQAVSKSASAVPEALFGIAVNNRSALEKSLALLHSRLLAVNNPDAKRQLLGYTIYRVDPRVLSRFRPGLVPMSTGSGPEAAALPMMAFAVTDTHLIAGVESTVESAIRTLASADAASVDSAAWFRAAKLSVPTAVGMVGMENTAASSELFWRMLKQSAKTDSRTMPVGGQPAMESVFGYKPPVDLFDADLLPEFDTVRKYFGSSTFYGVSRPDGFFFEFNYLTAIAGR